MKHNYNRSICPKNDTWFINGGKCGLHPVCKNCDDKGEFDFSKLKKVPEDSIEAKLFGLLDDIDTAIDIFKPKIKSFENYALNKIREAHKLIISDGYKLYYR
jgi:hypothetical protein